MTLHNKKNTVSDQSLANNHQQQNGLCVIVGYIGVISEDYCDCTTEDNVSCCHTPANKNSSRHLCTHYTDII